MKPAPAILVIDSNATDRALTTHLLQHQLPQSTIAAPPDALGFADALLAGKPDVAIVAPGVEWAKLSDLIGSIRRRSATTAVILFGHESEITRRAFDPGVACEGIVLKSSAGFLGLVTIVSEVLSRQVRTAQPAQDADADTNPNSRPDALAPKRAGGNLPRDLSELALLFSHHVNEPVQQIVRLVKRAKGGQAEGAVGDVLDRVLECAQRAGRILEGTMEHFSVASHDRPPLPIDLNACLTQALENLRSAIDESGAEIRTAPLPMSVGDSYRITQLFQNLISNAIKFRTGERPVLTISVEPRRGQWLLSFRDNGIGISAEFADRIFELGKRLHTREEYPGTGMGLALCRRIVEWHGGRIWVESREGEGSTFFVLLPRAEGGSGPPP